MAGTSSRVARRTDTAGAPSSGTVVGAAAGGRWDGALEPRGAVEGQGPLELVPGGLGQAVGEGVRGEPADLQRLVVTDARLAGLVAAQEAQVEVLRSVAVGVLHDRHDPGTGEADEAGPHPGLLLDLPHQRLGRLLPRLEDAGDQGPPAVVGAQAEQHLARRVDHDAGHPGQEQEVLADG